MADKMNYNDYVVTSIEEQEYIQKDFRKAIFIIGLSVISSFVITLLLYLL